MKTKYTISKTKNEFQIQDGYPYEVSFDITGKGSTKDQKNLNMGYAPNLVTAINMAIERMHDPYSDIIIIDHKSGVYKSEAQAKGGSKSKRKITPEQQAKMQASRKLKKSLRDLALKKGIKDN